LDLKISVKLDHLASPWTQSWISKYCVVLFFVLRLVLDEIYKGGEVDRRKLPRNFDSLSAREQVKMEMLALRASLLFTVDFR